LSGNEALFAVYWDGSLMSTLAALRADGIEMCERTGRDMSNRPAVLAAIQNPPTFPGICTKQDRQKFWTDVMLGDEMTQVVTKEGAIIDVKPDLMARLKASELMGRSEGDFKDKVEHSGEVTLAAFLEKFSAKPR
jgi:hypothetical protein